MNADDQADAEERYPERRVGIVGLGELGCVLAGELVRVGCEIVCLDVREPIPHIEERVSGLAIELVQDPVSFASGLDAVFVTAAGPTVFDIASLVVPSLQPGTVYVDCATKSVTIRDSIAKLCVRYGLPFVDLAVVDSVAVGNRPIHVLVSGPGAGFAVSALDGTRFVSNVLDDTRAVSAEVRMCRTIFTKGLAALLLETLAVAEQFNASDIIKENLTRVLARDFELLCDINVGTMIIHGVRRAAETASAAEQAAMVLGGAPMSNAVAEVYATIAQKLSGLLPTPNTNPAGPSSSTVVEQALAQGFFRSFAP